MGCSMRSGYFVFAGSSAVLTSLGLWAPALMAQDALTTAMAVEASALDTGKAEEGFLHRYTPTANTFELGAFLGTLFVSDHNSFRGPASVRDGATWLPPYSEYEQPSPELGLRAAYFPLSFLGGELEGMAAFGASDRGDSGTVLAARAHVVAQAPFWRLVPFVVGGAGYWAVLNDYSGDDTDPAFHFGGGVKLAANDNLRVDVRDTITNQRAIGDVPNSVEVMAGASLLLGRAKPVLDADGDGYLDDRDACTMEPGTAPDGCPVRDRDGDQVLDSNDQCPDQSGVLPSGCPAPADADADGVLDASDACVNDPGIAPSGCPDRDRDSVGDREDQCPDVAGVAPLGCPGDSDQDGMSDPDDKCPEQAETKNGFEDADGCPDEMPEAVKSFTGVIAGIEFDLSKASIRAGSFGSLDEAAKILNEYPSLRVEVAGHTDDTGARDYNVALSLERANAVKTYLVSQGIDAERILTRGAGPDEPLAKEKGPEARQKNRRIEFRIVE
jgi:outer membrane protein OmpA-like peptidoglycan-associated protein